MHPPLKDPKHKEPSKRAIKRVLANSGYSMNATDKIWEWYNPPRKKAASNRPKTDDA
ncbi:MAG: hypothetical protein ABSG33_03950 [Candidatus Bathyarchaeia archaeon]|jgi:hypothetical protein